MYFYKSLVFDLINLPPITVTNAKQCRAAAADNGEAIKILQPIDKNYTYRRHIRATKLSKETVRYDGEP